MRGVRSVGGAAGDRVGDARRKGSDETHAHGTGRPALERGSHASGRLPEPGRSREPAV